MKCLAIDSSYSKLTIASKNNDTTVTTSFNIGPKQSEKMLPAIDYVLKENNILGKDLDCTILCTGPGTFTGLRLAYSALKAIEMAYDIPIYGSGTLETYAYPYKYIDMPILSVLDAKKKRFYASLFSKGSVYIPTEDYTLENITEKILQFKKDSVKSFSKIFIAGPDSQLFVNNIVKTENMFVESDFITLMYEPEAVYSLFSIAEEKLNIGAQELKDFDGPSYYRASEAEENLTKK